MKIRDINNNTDKLKNDMKQTLLYSKIYTLLLLAVAFTTGSHAQSVQLKWVAKDIGSSTQSVAVDGLGNVYVAGSFRTVFYIQHSKGADTFSPVGLYDGFVAKYDAAGNYLWGKSMGGTSNDYVNGVAVDDKGNVYVGGYFSGEMRFNHSTATDTFRSKGLGDIFLAKYDANGNYQWARGMGGTGSEVGEKVGIDRAGNVYVVGSFNTPALYIPHSKGTDTLISAGGDDGVVVKYDANGNHQWARAIGGLKADKVINVATDGSNNIYVCGESLSSEGAYFRDGKRSDTLHLWQNADGFLAKYDANGTYQWARGMGGGGSDRAKGVTVTDGGIVYVAGSFQTLMYFGHSAGVDTLEAESPIDDGFVVRYDVNGNFQWAKNMGGFGIDGGEGVAADAAGNVYVRGMYGSPGIYFHHLAGTDTFRATGTTNGFVAKYSSDGIYKWARTLGNNSSASFGAIVASKSGNIYLGGGLTPPEAYLRTSSRTTDTIRSSAAFILMLSQGCEVDAILVRSACDNYTFNEVTYTKSGVYKHTFKAASGCDSIVTLALTIANSSVTPVVKAHYCDSVTLNGKTYTSSGTYTQHYTNEDGCDSNITYELTIGHNSPARSLTQTACYSFAFDNTVYTESGMYPVTFANKTGCDSVVTLNLTVINNPVALLRLSGKTLTANNAEKHQWINCSDKTIIPGATGKDFTPQQTGTYAVIATQGSCSDTSKCLLVEVTGNSINELSGDNRIQVYPNPADSRVTVQAERELKNATIRLVNIVGQSLATYSNQYGTTFTLDMSRYAHGIYFVEISEGNNMARLKVVKE